ncbi:glycine betaine/L-proline ABC transporter ATP-binding protein, partial [Marinomonas arenicola]
MQPQIFRISSDTIGEALIQMRQSKQDYGYVVNDEGYRGVITQETLENVEESDHS